MKDSISAQNTIVAFYREYSRYRYLQYHVREVVEAASQQLWLWLFLPSHVTVAVVAMAATEHSQAFFHKGKRVKYTGGP